MKNPFLRLAASDLGSLLLLGALGLSGCSEDGTGPKPELAPLVGKWRAAAMVLTNSANPSVSVDLIQEGATFTLSILSTGAYSASLTAFGQTNSEIGTIRVNGNQVTITPTSPPGPALAATFEFVGTLLVLDGDTAFDFNLDGTPEPALAHIELTPVP
jgi:hypothetical protein